MPVVSVLYWAFLLFALFAELLAPPTWLHPWYLSSGYIYSITSIGVLEKRRKEKYVVLR